MAAAGYYYVYSFVFEIVQLLMYNIKCIMLCGFMWVGVGGVSAYFLCRGVGVLWPLINKDLLTAPSTPGSKKGVSPVCKKKNIQSNISRIFYLAPHIKQISYGCW